MRPRTKIEQGFSLIELSILLTVFAIVAATALSWLAPSAIDEAKKIEVTKQRLHNIQQALRAFRVHHGRLPCAADRTLADDNPKAGEENCTGVVDSGSNVFNLGVVPVRSLGIDLSNMSDGWGRRFTYHVSLPLCDQGPGGSEAYPLNCTQVSYRDNAGDLEVRTYDTDAPTAVYDDADTATYDVVNAAVAYVIVSHGPNGDGAWMPSGTQRNAGTGSDRELLNVDRPTASPAVIEPDVIYWTEAYNVNFDDIVLFEAKESDAATVDNPANQIDQALMDYDDWALTQAECLDISTRIAEITGAITTEMDAVDMGQVESEADTMQRVLWFAQEVCAAYYPADYATPATDIQCPSGREFNPTAAVPVDNPQGYCECPGGTSWDTGAHECN